MHYQQCNFLSHFPCAVPTAVSGFSGGSLPARKARAWPGKHKRALGFVCRNKLLWFVLKPWRRHRMSKKNILWGWMNGASISLTEMSCLAALLLLYFWYTVWCLHSVIVGPLPGVATGIHRERLQVWNQPSFLLFFFFFFRAGNSLCDPNKPWRRLQANFVTVCSYVTGLGTLSTQQ